MKNNIRTFTKENFSLQEFVDFTKDCNTTAIIYNSKYSLKASEQILKDNMLHNFEKIIGIANVDEIIARFLYKIEPDFDGYSLQNFYNFYNGLIYVRTKLPINRKTNLDAYENYTNIICTEDTIILC